MLPIPYLTLAAKVLNTDVYADLAVLKAEGEMPAVATFGNSDTLRPGESVVEAGRHIAHAAIAARFKSVVAKLAAI